MYNLESEMRLFLLLSSVATILAKIQDENKQKQEVRPRED